MYLLENPVLQRELLVNLRMVRAFVLLFVYQALLGAVVYFAWPQDTHLDLTANSQHATQTRALVDLFFIGQFVIASMMAPSFAAGSITGEKERHTYEMLLASPLRPAAIVLGKLVAALTHLAVLIFASLPIVMLCLPLGGVSVYEVLAAYIGLILSVITFGMISVACSAFFQRTSAALVVSYLLILPLVIIGAIFWLRMARFGEFRLMLILTVLPALSAAAFLVLFFNTSSLLLHPPDVGSEGKEVVDLEQEAQQAVGLVIQRDQFPDKLFAPPKRDDLMEDDANPVYDKEIRSEIFSQGTLMLRLVIQVSMVLAIPFMAVCLYIWPIYAAWYISYVVVFNMLVGPVFSAGSVTSERERETLDLLLTTIISPWQILWGKLIAGLRVSSVLTLFLVWPVLLACAMVKDYWTNLPSVGAYFSIILLTCLTTAMIALFCSVLFRTTSMSLMTTYLVIILLFCAPLAVNFFAQTFFQDHPNTPWVAQMGFTSPFAAAFAVPLDISLGTETLTPDQLQGNWPLYALYVGFTVAMNGLLLVVMMWLFSTRWRVAA
ncbi:ABC-2 family transporter protein [Anatilimnocola aggregata]|uniref:ABC-2 family transporter protein n=1 Tax=Anatilimnocola aggregata TaxID=2528021 RepID=A0A517YBL8_9BACT|nr:ABC transporter permease subunit [Anatilimnocola aggregata]QDU27614.1 ABC-2 family transporter protein [Anatilimnocola aggregata]